MKNALLTIILVLTYWTVLWVPIHIVKDRLSDWVCSFYEHPGGRRAVDAIHALNLLLVTITIVGALAIIYWRL